MKKSKLNFLINGLMFLCMSAIVGIGFLIEYTLISGQKKWALYNDNMTFYLFGMTRHEWGTIHLILGYVLLALLILHIIFHLKAITGVYNQIFKGKLIGQFISIIFISICILFLVTPFLVKPTIAKLDKGEGRLNTSYNNYSTTKMNKIPKKKETNVIEILNTPSHSDSQFKIKGCMTLNEISKKYKIPTTLIKSELNIPQNISSEKKLGWIKKRYHINMNDFKNFINKHKRK